MLVHLRNNVVTGVICEEDPAFPGTSIKDRYAPDYLAECIPTDDNNVKAGYQYNPSDGTFTPAIYQPSGEEVEWAELTNSDKQYPWITGEVERVPLADNEASDKRRRAYEKLRIIPDYETKLDMLTIDEASNKASLYLFDSSDSGKRIVDYYRSEITEKKQLVRNKYPSRNTVIKPVSSDADVFDVYPDMYELLINIDADLDEYFED